MKKFILTSYHIRLEPVFAECTGLSDDLYDGIENKPPEIVMDVNVQDEKNCIEAVKRYFSVVQNGQ